MTKVHALLMTKNEPGAWMLMPQFLARIYNFTVAFDPVVDANLVLRGFEEDFGSGQGMMLGIAIVDEAFKVRGSLLAGIEMYRRQCPYALVHQYEIDHDVYGGKQLAHTCLQLVESWAESKKLHRIRALAEPGGRVRLFGAIGMSAGPMVLNKELSHG